MGNDERITMAVFNELCRSIETMLRCTLWTGALRGGSRLTLGRKAALESGRLAYGCDRYCHSGGKSAAVYIR